MKKYRVNIQNLNFKDEKVESENQVNFFLGNWLLFPNIRPFLPKY